MPKQSRKTKSSIRLNNLELSFEVGNYEFFNFEEKKEIKFLKIGKICKKLQTESVPTDLKRWGSE